MIINEALDCVTRVGSLTSCVRSNSCNKFGHLLFVHRVRSILKSPISKYSNTVACAIESLLCEHLVDDTQNIVEMV